MSSRHYHLEPEGVQSQLNNPCDHRHRAMERHLNAAWTAHRYLYATRESSYGQKNETQWRTEVFANKSEMLA